jgi:hypothetical protein
MGHILWLAFGLLTAFLYYRKSEKINVFFAAVITLFGLISAVVWLLFNIRTEVKNPFYGVGLVSVYEKPIENAKDEELSTKTVKKSTKK